MARARDPKTGRFIAEQVAESKAETLQDTVQGFVSSSTKTGTWSRFENAMRRVQVHTRRTLRNLGKQMDETVFNRLGLGQGVTSATSWLGDFHPDLMTKGLVGMAATVAVGSAAVGAVASYRRHRGRAKVGYNSQNTLLSLGAGLGVLGVTRNPIAALGVFSAAALSLNTAHDVQRLHYTPSFALGKNLVTGVGAAVAYSLVTKKGPDAVQSLSTALSRLGVNSDQGLAAFGNSLKAIVTRYPKMSPLLSISGLGLMASTAAIPTMHSIIMRSSAKARRLANDAQASAESANITSKQHHQAGHGHKQQSGAIMNPTRQNIDLNFSGQIRGAYNTQNAMRGVLN